MSEPTITPPGRRPEDRTSQELATIHDVNAAKRKAERNSAILFVLGLVATLLSGFLSVRAVAQDAGREEAKGIAADQKTQAAQLVLQAAAFERHLVEDAAFKAMVVRKFEKQDEKQDLVLDALRVPLWKRPEPETKDGGK